MASPAKRPKCRYDFVAFTWRFSLQNTPWTVNASRKRWVCSLRSQLFEPPMLKIFLSLCIIKNLLFIFSWLNFASVRPISPCPVLPTPRFTRPIGLLWNPLPRVKKLLGGWPKIGLLFIRLPAAALFSSNLPVSCQFREFWASSMSKNILFINFRDYNVLQSNQYR